jgi:hypothetical protein
LLLGCGNNLEIDHPITGAKIKIAERDFSEKKEFIDAMQSCASLGKGWRLPSKEELMEMYKRREKIGNFKNKIYLSFSPSMPDYSSGNMFGIDFNNGKVVVVEYPTKAYVRAVKEIGDETSHHGKITSSP